MHIGKHARADVDIYMYTDAPQFARAPRVQFVAARGCEPFLHGSHSGTSAMSPKNATVSERRQAILEPPAVKGRGCVCVYIRLRRSKCFQVFAFPGKKGEAIAPAPPNPPGYASDARYILEADM